MPARASFTLDDGIATSSWNATFAFRIRVSMSAIGSVIVTALEPPGSPRRLRHAGDLARVGHLPEADAAQAELAVHGPRAPTPATPGVGAHPELRGALLLLDQCLLRHVGSSC